MTRLTLALLVIITLLLCAVVYGQSRGFIVGIGPVHATDQERIECSFGIGPETMIIFHPKSTACQIMTQELLGRSIRLQATIEDQK